MHHLHRIASKYLLWLLLTVYALAAILPNFGLAIRSVNLVKLPWVGKEGLNIGLPSGLLAVLLFNAGMCMQTSEIFSLLRRPALLFFGVIGNLLMPCLVIFLFNFGLSHWHSSVEVHTLLASLSIVIAMPIAGASTAWSQNSNGNVALSLGLVIVSTLISPLTTPLAIHFISSLSMAENNIISDLQFLQSSGGLGSFLVYVIVLPSLLGIVVHRLLGDMQSSQIKEPVKCLNILILLVLNYSNAATSLPEILRTPDWDFIGLVVLVTGSLCMSGFVVGWYFPRLIGTPRSERISLMYGLGMNNNGSALVIAATVFPGKPLLMLPIITYNLLQHVVSGIANFLIVETDDFNQQDEKGLQLRLESTNGQTDFGKMREIVVP